MSVATHEGPRRTQSEMHRHDISHALTVAAQMARCLLPDFDQVSLTLISTTGTPAPCARVGNVVAALDRLQHGVGEGPCLDSLRTSVPVVAPHIHRDDRWRHYVPAAARLGLRSQVAAPLPGREDKPMGVLNLYSTTRGEIAPTVPLVVDSLAAQVAGVLIGIREIEHLHRALATRKTIGVAIGLLMARHQLSETAAYAVLRHQSSHANIKLRDVAARMVADAEEAGDDLDTAAIC